MLKFWLPILTVLLCLTACTPAGLFMVNQLAKFDTYSSFENIAYGPDPLNRLSVYVPENPVKTTPLVTVIFFYGGCWGGCEVYDKDKYLFVAQALTAQGHIVVLCDYRHFPQVRFPQIIEDASKTVEWVVKNISNYGGDSERIFLMGHSAGAHLGAMLTLNEDYLHPQSYSRIKGFIGLAGPYDFLPFTKPYQKAVFAPPSAYPQSQPINFVDGTEPPLLLLHGKCDDIVKIKNSKNLANKILLSGGQVETHFYALDHSEILAALTIPLQSSKPVLSDISEFIQGVK
jgi:acetyl esterase/lipase